MRRRFALILPLLLIAAPLSAQPMIPPGLMQRVELKQGMLGKSAIDRAQFMERHVIKQGYEQAESLAVYVSRPLDEKEIEELRAQGIVLCTANYVPPLPPRHPFGFYLATARHDALPALFADPRFVLLESMESAFFPTNEVSRQLLGIEDLHAGLFPLPQSFTGTGVRVAVADSGFDTDHPDLPVPVEAFNVVNGTSPAQWTTGLKHSGDRHGTHVAGIVLGRGTASAGRFRGMAPNADFFAYRISNRTDGAAQTADIIEAINRASEVGCHVFNLSYGGFEIFPDGSSAASQAIDVAVNNGMVVVVSAGNSRNRNQHFRGSVAAGESETIGYRIGASGGYSETDILQLLWRPEASEPPSAFPLTFTVTNLAAGESFVTNNTSDYVGVSPRGTKVRLGELTAAIPSGTKIFQIEVTNTAASGVIDYSLYFFSQASTQRFETSSETFTINSPSVADLALSVGSHVHQTSWTRWDGTTATGGGTLGQISPFSSFGPRIDGVLKPDLLAPGQTTISLHTSSTSGVANLVVGPGDTLETARYYAISGTSMAAPVVAGLVALMKEAAPSATALELREALLSTAGDALSPNTQRGVGLPRAVEAVTAARAASLRAEWLLY